MSPLEQFLRGYIAALLWSSTVEGHDGEDHNANEYDPSESLKEESRADCQAFFDANKADIEDAAGLYDLSRSDGADTGYDFAGHDFALTRNGHGAGYWDGDLPKNLGARLTEASKKAGECNVILGDDNLVYIG